MGVDHLAAKTFFKAFFLFETVIADGIVNFKIIKERKVYL